MAEETKTMTDDADPMFVTLVLSLSTSAMAYLGKIPHPTTGKIERDLDQAMYSIEILAMLERKTQGGITDKERRLLANVVADLKLNYADEATKEQQGAGKTVTAQGGQPQSGGAPDIILPPGVSPSARSTGSGQAGFRPGSGKGPEIIKP